MNMRKMTSLTALLSFVVMLVTSIILYLVPQGRIAYWSDWRLLGLTKTDWGNIHINTGFLFLTAIALHIYYNWKPLVVYLKNKARQLKVFTPDFTAALIIVVTCIVGTYFLWPPFSWVMALNDHVKQSAALKYGEPPFGHAELSSLTSFARKLDLELAECLRLLEEAGYRVDSPELTLLQIAKQYQVTPKTVYRTIQPASRSVGPTGDSGAGLPAKPPPGSGNLTLAQIATRYHLDLERWVEELNRLGIDASANQTLKEIAAAHRKGPADVYGILKEGAAAARSPQ
jgi:hypothetical protein